MEFSFAWAWKLEVELCPGLEAGGLALPRPGGWRCSCRAEVGAPPPPANRCSRAFPHHFHTAAKPAPTCTKLHRTCKKNYTKLHQTCTKLIKLAKLPKLPGCSRFCFSNVVARQTGTRWTFNNATAKCTLHTSTNLTLHTTINCSQLQCNCQHATHWVKT